MDYLKMHIAAVAKQLAWDDLDQYDQKVYWREAQKQLSKYKIWMNEETNVFDLEMPKQPKGWISRADSSVSLPKNKKDKKRK